MPRRPARGLFSRVALALAVVLVILLPPVRTDDQLPSDVNFNLKQSFLEDLMTGGPNGRTVGLRWKTPMKMGEHSDVHTIGNDCEIHVGAKMPNNRILAHPAGIVVEPPNVCKERVPQIPQTGSIGNAWTSYFDANVTDKTCDVVGFPRIYAEHSSGGGTDGSNPDHVVEIHPAISMKCGTNQEVNFLPLLKIHKNMRRITDNSARTCLEDRRLFVRRRGSSTQVRYEFLEEGALGGSGGQCGNFVVVDARIGKEYLRELSNGGDHTALVRVWVGESGPYPLKVYTYKGTPEDDAIAHLMADDDEYATIEMELHGLLTYDYLWIAHAVQDANFAWLPASALQEYKEIPRPLSLVVFGQAIH